MLVLVCIVHLWINLCFTFPLKARRGLNRQNCSRQNSVQANTARSLTLRSVSLRRVRLRGVSLLDHQKIKLSTSRSVSQFWIFEKYSIFFEISSYGSSIACLEMKIFENLKNLC